MEPREQRGLVIAATTKLTKNKGSWSVPSQSGNGRYVVDVFEDGSYVHCTCPDFETRREPCKHIYAVRYTMTRETVTDISVDGDGNTTVTQTETIKESVRVTYAQNWPAYNAAQTNEKRLFLQLLRDLCAGIEEPEYDFGRPKLPLADMIFCSAYKVYSTVSGRRFMTDLNEAHDKGYISRAPHYNSIFNYMENADLTPLLKSLIVQSALPLRAIESNFAIDSSGFGSSRFVKWFDVKHKGEVSFHDWVKLHMVCGVKTNIVVSAEITDRDTSDLPLLPGLVTEAARNFTINELSADKGYSSLQNHAVVNAVGGTPFIAFKENAVGGTVPVGKERVARAIWNKMFHFYSYNKETFLDHYHKRSNAESTFSMIKAKFGNDVRSKSDTGMVNEALLKVICHNICVVIQSIYELGIEAKFA